MIVAQLLGIASLYCILFIYKKLLLGVRLSTELPLFLRATGQSAAFGRIFGKCPMGEISRPLEAKIAAGGLYIDRN
jgi:hypothetical protein